MQNSIVELERVARSVLTLIDIGDINRIDHVLVAFERMAQLYHDHSAEWGNDRTGLDSCDDPADEAHFQVGYSLSVLADRMGQRDDDLDALRSTLNVRTDVIDALGHFSFDTYAHGQSRRAATK